MQLTFFNGRAALKACRANIMISVS